MQNTFLSGIFTHLTTSVTGSANSDYTFADISKSVCILKASMHISRAGMLDEDDVCI